MPGTRTFFALCCAAAILLIGVPLALGFGSADAQPAPVTRGAAAWRDLDCAGCHTLAGAGAPYAADLTHISTRLGAARLRAFLTNPPALHPAPDAALDDLLAFLGWIDAHAAPAPALDPLAGTP